MADYKVGNLQIAFEAIDKTSADFKELAKNLRALQKLITNIGNADITPFVNNIKALRKEMSPLLTKIQGASQGIAEFNAVTKELGVKNISKATTELENLAQVSLQSANSVEDVGDAIDGVYKSEKKLSDNSEKVIGIWEKFSDRAIKSTLALEQQRQQILKNKIAFLELNLVQNKTGFSSEILQEELEKLRAELGQQEPATKKATSGWKKFIKSIGRIALYRTIRRALQLITQSITESIQEFAKLDDNFNNTMSSITSSLKVIQLSFGSIFIPLLQAIEPILSSIADGFANFANTLSQALATGDTYWAINSKAIKDYREQLQKTTGTLASFDKINSLNLKDDTFIFFEERQVDKENQAVKDMGITIKSITNIIQGLWNIISIGWNNIVKPIFNAVYPYINVIIEGITEVISWVGKALKKLEEVGLIKPILLGIIGALSYLYSQKIINGISKLISKFNKWYLVLAAVGAVIGILANWDDFNRETKTAITVISALISALTAAAIAALYLNGALSFGTGVALALTSAAAGVVALRGMLDKEVNGFSANIPDSAAVARASSGSMSSIPYSTNTQSSNTDTTSTEQAFYNALVRYSRENRGGDTTTPIYIDGSKVFEAVQRNANKKGLGFVKI